MYNEFVRILKNNYKTYLILGLIIVLYFALRLPNLTYQPIFADEAIYIRWAQVMKSEPTLRFLPLTDGKTPLFMWIMMPVFKLIADPLLAGRTLAVFSGIGTLLGAFMIGIVFFNKRVALFAAFLIAITPYIIFFDRMALVDTMLSAFTIWGVFLALLLVRFPRIDLAMVLGFVLGGGLLTKTPAMFNVITMPISALTLNFSPKGRVRRVLQIFGLFLISIVFALGIYNLLRLGPGFTSLNSRNSDYVRDPLDLLKNPLDPFMPHLGDVMEWWPLFMGYPIILVIFFGAIYGIYKKNKYIITILLMALIPMIVEMALLRTFTARYLLTSIPLFLVIGAFGIDKFLIFFKQKQLLLTLGVLIILIAWPFYFTNKLMTDINNAPLPHNERRGYLEDWTAGQGLRDIATFLNNESKKQFIIIGTEGSFGTLPDGLQIYFDKNTQVAFKPGKSNLPPELVDEASRSAVYFVANQSRFLSHDDNVELLQTYLKAKPRDPQYKQDAILLFKVHPVTKVTP